MKIFQRMTLAVFLCFSISCSASGPDRDFHTFWAKFKAASLSNNYSALEKLTHFPLEVRGVADEMPVEKYAKNQLPEIFPKLMDQTVIQIQGNEYVSMVFRDVIAKTDRVKIAAEDTDVRVEQFEFQIIDGTWYLTRAYLEEE